MVYIILTEKSFVCMEDQQDETEGKKKKAVFYPFSMNGKRKQEKRGNRGMEREAVPLSGKYSIWYTCMPWIALFIVTWVQSDELEKSRQLGRRKLPV